MTGLKKFPPSTCFIPGFILFLLQFFAHRLVVVHFKLSRLDGAAVFGLEHLEVGAGQRCEVVALGRDLVTVIQKS